MGKGGGEGSISPWAYYGGGGAERYWVSSARRPPHPPPVQFGGNVTSTRDATDGSQFRPASLASQSQNPAGSSVVVEEVPRLPGEATELAARSVILTPDLVVAEEVPRLPGEATELAARSVILTPDSVVVEEVPRLPGEATELAARSVILTPDSVVVQEVPRFPGELVARSVILTPDSVVVEEVPRFPGEATELAARSVILTPDSVVVEEVPRLPGEATELAARSAILTPDSVVVEEVPKFPGQAKKLATSGVPNPDSEGLGGRNEGSEEALVVQLHGALHGLEELDRAARVFIGVARNTIAVLLRCVRSLDYLRQKPCEYSLPNGEKAGKSSDAPYPKRKKLWVSKNFPGVRQRGDSFVSEIHLPGKKNKFWLGTFKTAEAAAQAFQVAADWREAHRDSESFSNEELDDLKKRAQKAGEHLSDDRSRHNVASPDLAATLASSKGKAVASPEHVSQRKSPAHENVSSPDWESFSDL